MLLHAGSHITRFCFFGDIACRIRDGLQYKFAVQGRHVAKIRNPGAGCNIVRFLFIPAMPLIVY